MAIEGEYLATDHQHRFVIGADYCTMYVMALDEAEVKKGRQEYCWKKVATFKRTKREKLK